MSNYKIFLTTTLVIASSTLTSCRTKSEIRREQEFERLKQEVTQTRGDRAEVDSSVEELRVEIAKLGNVIEEEAQGRRKESEELRKEVTALAARLQALEQRAVSEELAQKQLVQEKAKASYDAGRRLYDDGKYEEAIDVLKAVVENQPKSEDGKKSQFLLGESYFATKDYRLSGSEFSRFLKNFPKDAMVPNAIYRLAASLKEMGNGKDAKLFYEELIQRYPASPFAKKAKVDIKRLK
ncbi:outer membrane protein assembly factor BamD [bacterium]|nr:outer membrane protein assembly factor BamD [bacterium]